MIKVIFFILLLIQTTNQAHPVTWKSGSVSSFRSTNSIKELKIHYSVSSRYAFGFHGVTLFDKSYIMAQQNLLINRVNSKHSQSNIYYFFGLGSNVGSDTILHQGLQADWETQSLYTQLNIDSYFKRNTVAHFRYRFGFAPYVVGYYDLQPWIIAQLNSIYTNGNFSNTLMPVIRLFGNNLLVEFGYNLNQDYMATIMHHF